MKRQERIYSGRSDQPGKTFVRMGYLNGSIRGEVGRGRRCRGTRGFKIRKWDGGGIEKFFKNLDMAAILNVIDATLILAQKYIPSGAQTDNNPIRHTHKSGGCRRK